MLSSSIRLLNKRHASPSSPPKPLYGRLFLWPGYKGDNLLFSHRGAEPEAMAGVSI
jgi:hypothetical protein